MHVYNEAPEELLKFVFEIIVIWFLNNVDLSIATFKMREA